MAGDASTAAEELSKRLDEEQSLAEYLDHVAIPALSIAAADTSRGILRPDQSDSPGVDELALLKAYRDFVVDLTVAWTQSIKSFATGLKVRPFRLTIATGRGPI